jgi:hypothetical protein
MRYESLPRSKAELESERARESLAAPATLRRLAVLLRARAGAARQPLAGGLAPPGPRQSRAQIGGS